MKKILMIVCLVCTMLFMNVCVFAAGMDNWQVLPGGLEKFDSKKVIVPCKAEVVDDGILFTGGAGYGPTEDGTTTAGAGGLYKEPVSLDKFSVEFTINKFSYIENNIDSWFSVSFTNVPKYFNVLDPKTITGLTLLFRPLRDRIDVPVYACDGAGFTLINAAGSTLEWPKDNKFRFEFAKEQEEGENFYYLSINGKKNQAYGFKESDIKKWFQNNKAYVSVSTQSSDINQELSLTVNKINNTSFGTSGGAEQTEPADTATTKTQDTAATEDTKDTATTSAASEKSKTENPKTGDAGMLYMVVMAGAAAAGAFAFGRKIKK